ncbi:MAG: S9 family peptidase [Bacteroidales bacterium]|nr:S9 family peptidase [Bacteroidales bacterium]
MRRIFLTIAVASLSIIASAQEGVLKSHPANPSEGKILSMSETILSRELSPALDNYTFYDGSLIVYKDKKWRTDSGEEFKPAPRKWYVQEKDGAIFLSDKSGEQVKKIAGEDIDGIVYGKSVSRNEFGIEGGIFISPDSTKIAFYRKDETRVSKFPLLDITSRTGTLKEIRYPMAGMDSELITLGVYDIESESTVYLDVDDFTQERYLTTVTWTPDSKKICVQVMDRAQKNIHFNVYDAADGKFLKTVLTESNDKYVEPRDKEVWFLKGSDTRFIYRTDNRDGYRNLYLCDLEGNVERLTKVDAEVQYVGNDGQWVWYTSAEVSPIENHLFRVSVATKPKKGRKAAHIVERLSFETGWHDIEMASDCSCYIDRWSSLNFPGQIDLKTPDGKTIKTLCKAEDPTKDYAYTQIDLGTVKSADGKWDNYYRLIKPKDFDPSKKYPTIIYVYGGPHSQMVQDKWLGQLRRWEMYMAQRGYLVYVQDNRGTDNRGSEFEKAIWHYCGQCEMADQMEGVKMLMNLPYVDKDRIGVHGWSYGGFMTISLITNYPEVFKVGVAGGPVIDWKWYEVMYGERYMGTPQDNEAGFAKTSLIAKAKDLKGKLLICQGAIDNTVVWQHSLNFIQECIDQDIQVDYFPYPVAEHNVFGKNRVHLMDKVSLYFEDYL